MDISEIQAFVLVVRAGGFSTASRQNQVPKSTLSRKVSDLEKRLGASLLQRTTRVLRLTTEGKAYFDVCAHALSDMEQASQHISQLQNEPQGVIRFTAPIETGSSLLPDSLNSFMKLYPKIELEIVLTDRVVDIVGERFDIALRAGTLRDSTLKAKRISLDEFRLYASSVYLKNAPPIKEPSDLESHKLLVFTGRPTDPTWILCNGPSRIRVKFRNTVRSNSLLLLKSLAALGGGVALLPHFVAQECLANGELMRILPKWSTERSPFYLVYPPQKNRTQRVKLFIEHLAENLNFPSV